MDEVAFELGRRVKVSVTMIHGCEDVHPRCVMGKIAEMYRFLA